MSPRPRLDRSDLFPATVTVGRKDDGTLVVRTFATRADAEAAAFAWVGREPSFAPAAS